MTKTKITVRPTAVGYSIKIKRPKEQPVYLELDDSEVEQLKTGIVQSWWIKKKESVYKKYDVTEEELLKQVSPLHSFSSLVKHEETVLCSSLQIKRKQKAQTDSRFDTIRSIADIQQNLHSAAHYNKV